MAQGGGAASARRWGRGGAVNASGTGPWGEAKPVPGEALSAVGQDLAMMLRAALQPCREGSNTHIPALFQGIRGAKAGLCLWLRGTHWAYVRAV